MFCPKDEDEVQAEITFAGSVAPVKKYRRDFLTAGLIDRAVVQASVEAIRWEYHENTEIGMSSERLIAALDRQVRSTVEQVNEANVHSYTDIEDGVRIASVRRMEPPAMQPYQLVRVA
jgi:hypothetical protein